LRLKCDARETSSSAEVPTSAMPWLIGQRVNDILRFERAAPVSRTPRDVALALRLQRASHPSRARVLGMKSVHEFRSGRTIIVIGMTFVWAWASQQAHSQNLDCNNGCGTYAEYALAQRLRLPASIQNSDRSGIAAWFSRHPQYSRRLKALAAECESSCAECGDWTCP
jgi:hypothetical protein